MTDGLTDKGRDAHILSVQSHVARDYVGNRACALALQLMGHEVDVVNTVQFSSMYVHQGSIMGEEEIERCLSGLETVMACPRGAGRVGAAVSHKAICHDLSVVMGGYIGNPKVLASLCDHVSRWKGLECVAPNAERLSKMLGIERAPLFVMDPVMGDNGHLYVSQEMVREYRGQLASADIVTPNFYELEWLTNERLVELGPDESPDSTKGSDTGVEDSTPKGKCYHSLQNILDRIAMIHKKGPKIVCVTSCTFDGMPEDHLLAVASVQSATPFSVLCMFPKHEVYLGGCGDVTCAMFVDRLVKLADGEQMDLQTVMRRAVLTTMEAMQVCMIKATSAQSASINVVKLAEDLECNAIVLRSSRKLDTPVSGTRALDIDTLSHAACTVVQGYLTAPLVIQTVGALLERS